MKRTKKVYTSGDLFCGGGGTSTGMLGAFAKLEVEYEHFGINHWQIAINTNQQNHPGDYYCATIDAVDPCDVVKSGHLDFLWASPECTNHSRAKGGKPKSNQSRCQPEMLLNWVRKLIVRRLYVENVIEFQDWGPLLAKNTKIGTRMYQAGTPDPRKKGVFFRNWVESLKCSGYRVDWQVMNAADYGAPTTRRRLIVQAVRIGTGEKIIWPHPTHAKEPGLFGEKPWRAAREIIDWGIKGTSIFERKKPLAANTMRRIEAGIRKYWGEWAEPFLVILRGTAESQDCASVKPVSVPLPCVSAGGIHAGVVTPFVSRYNGGDERHHPTTEPLPVVDCSNRYGIVEPIVINLNGTTPSHIESSSNPAGAPIPTLTTTLHVGVMEPFITTVGGAEGQGRQPHGVDSPLGTILTNNHRVLVEPFIIATGQTSGGDRSKSVDEPISTVVTKAEHCLVDPFVVAYYGANKGCKTVGEPLDTVTTKDKFGLVNGRILHAPDGKQYKLDILFRMLEPHELSAAMGFPPEYQFTGSKKDQVKQIGNAVCPPLAEALIGAAFEETA